MTKLSKNTKYIVVIGTVKDGKKGRVVGDEITLPTEEGDKLVPHILKRAVAAKAKSAPKPATKTTPPKKKQPGLVEPVGLTDTTETLELIAGGTVTREDLFAEALKAGEVDAAGWNDLDEERREDLIEGAVLTLKIKTEAAK